MKRLFLASASRAGLAFGTAGHQSYASPRGGADWNTSSGLFRDVHSGHRPGIVSTWRPFCCADYWDIRAAAPLTASVRSMYTANAASFESEVLQSTQAIVLVYHTPLSTSCRSYLATVDRAVAAANKNTPAAVSSAIRNSRPEASVEACHADKDSPPAWVKAVSIDGDQNVNLASAFSVERAKLPVTFFIMNATIIDRVNGAVSEERLAGILEKFKEYFYKHLNIDLTQGMGASSDSIPFGTGASEKVSLTSGGDYIQTQQLADRVISALVGPESIMLPREIEKLDGLKRSLQQLKRQAYDELAELHNTSLRLNVRRLSEEEMIAKYYRSSQFSLAAMSASLEALFLAKIYAYLGQLAESNVTDALNDVKTSFKRTVSHEQMQRLLSLVEVNLVRAHVRVAAFGGVLPDWALNGGEGLGAGREEDRLIPPTPSAQADIPVLSGFDDAGSTAQILRKPAADAADAARQFYEQLLRWCDLVDGRLPPRDFPTDELEKMFALLKALRPHMLREERADLAEPGLATRRFEMIRTLINAVLCLFPTHERCGDARARLSSLVF